MCEVEIKTGRNIWLLARTDRDGATEGEVLQSALAFLESVLPGAQKWEVIQVPDARPDVATGSIGHARPVVVTTVRGGRGGQYSGAMMPGALMGRSQSCEGELLRVRATRPWWVRVGFDWRAGDTKISWPRLRVSDLGFRDTSAVENDWLLVEARFSDSEMTEDVSWSDAVLRGTGQAVSEAVVALGRSMVVPLVIAGTAVGVLALLFLWGRR